MSKSIKSTDQTVKPAGKKRGRPFLTQEDKAHMEVRRMEAATEKKNALEILSTNPQFTNPKFWGMVDTVLVQAVAVAISKGGEKAKKAKAKSLSAKIQAMQAELTALQPGE